MFHEVKLTDCGFCGFFPHPFRPLFKRKEKVESGWKIAVEFEIPVLLALQYFTFRSDGFRNEIYEEGSESGCGMMIEKQGESIIRIDVLFSSHLSHFSVIRFRQCRTCVILPKWEMFFMKIFGLQLNLGAVRFRWSGGEKFVCGNKLASNLHILNLRLVSFCKSVFGIEPSHFNF